LEFFARGLSAFARAPVVGSGTASLIDPASGLATAHSVYLSVLGKFGLIGGLAFAAFIFGPIIVSFSRRAAAVGDRLLAALCVLPLTAMYLAYDFFQFLEFQFVVYAIAYAAVLPLGRSPHQMKNSAKSQ
jgi:O-antigen ligase